MIPTEIRRYHIVEALDHIDLYGVPAGRQVRTYALVYGDQLYPPKYTVALAAELATGTPLASDEFGGGAETNRFLQRLGFEVRHKDDITTPLRVAVVSLRVGPTETDALANVFAVARSEWEGRLLVLFPGASEHWSEDVDRFVALAKRHDASAIAELRFPEGHRYTAYRAGADTVDDLRIAQVFGEAAEADRDPSLVDRVLQECEPGGPRRIDIEGVGVGVIVCGENNLLQSRQAEGNRCDGIRNHPGRELLPGVDIVLNGAHTIMGNWDKLNKRFAWMAQGPRVFAYTTNNDNKHAWSTALRLHYGDARLVTGDTLELDAVLVYPTPVHFVQSTHYRVAIIDHFQPYGHTR